MKKMLIQHFSSYLAFEINLFYTCRIRFNIKFTIKTNLSNVFYSNLSKKFNYIQWLKINSIKI